MLLVTESRPRGAVAEPTALFPGLNIGLLSASLPAGHSLVFSKEPSLNLIPLGSHNLLSRSQTPTKALFVQIIVSKGGI